MITKIEDSVYKLTYDNISIIIYKGRNIIYYNRRDLARASLVVKCRCVEGDDKNYFVTKNRRGVDNVYYTENAVKNSILEYTDEIGYGYTSLVEFDIVSNALCGTHTLVKNYNLKKHKFINKLGYETVQFPIVNRVWC